MPGTATQRPLPGDAIGDGVQLPLAGERRASTPVVRGILADAAATVDDALAARVRACSAWRSGYVELLRELTLAGAGEGRAEAIARAGLDSMRAQLELAHGGRTVPLAQASLEHGATHELGTGEIRGQGRPAEELRIPYRGGELHGEALALQLDRWVAAGTIEPSVATAVARVMDNPQWLSLPGRTIALVGAGAEAGPLEPLSQWGADVLAIELPRPELWRRIGEVAQEGAGTVRMPMLGEQQGADLLVSLPELHAWLVRAGGGETLVLGMHAYADGATHVRLSAAFDTLATSLGRTLAEPPALAFLATPTDAYLVPQDIVSHARAAYARPRPARPLQASVRALSRGRLLAPAYSSGAPVADALVTQQGPNYAVAKRLQRWRGVLAEAEGQRVSFNVAPATWTRSVTSNRVLAAAYTGARLFGIEVFAPRTTRTLMAALLVHDLCAEAPRREHAEELFSDAAAHGGLWRAAYEPRSALTLAAVAGLPATFLRRSA